MGSAASAARPASRRAIAWIGGVFLAAILAQAAYEIVSSHGAAVRSTEREIDAQARVIAEQSARSIQAVDVVLRQVAEQHRRGQLAGMDGPALRAHLQAQASGLVQVDGIAMFGADGILRGSSITPVERWPQVNIAGLRPFQRLRDQPDIGLMIDAAIPSPGSGLWIFPMGRRLESATGRFDGVMGAGGMVEYFESFYRATYPDPSMRVALLHREGWLLARQPRSEKMLGQRVTILDQLVPSHADSPSTVTRIPSPIDGVDHFVAVRLVPGYPLVVAVSRDAAAALAPWRSQAVATAVRTLALGGVAGWLLVIVLRQFRRLDEAHESLATSEARYAQAMTGSNEGHWLWSLPERQVYVSQRLAELFGFAGGAQVLHDDDYFARIPIHPDDRARVHFNRAEHVAGRTERLDHEFRIVDPASGEVRWMHTRAQCFRDAEGRALRLAGSTVDATRRKQAELDLRASEERYVLAMTGSRSGHWVWDAATDSLYVSPTMNELVGLPADTRPGTRTAYFQRVNLHPEDMGRIQQLSTDLLRGEIPRAEAEYRIVLPDGQLRWILNRAQRFPTGDPGDARIAGVSIDITDRKAAEAERERLAAQLRQAQKLEAIGTLAGGIAHDFNNILSAILGYGELVQRDAPAASALRRHIDAAMSAGHRAKSLVERILAFSRGGMGERVPVHVGSVVDEALLAVRASLPEGIRLDAQLHCGDAGLIGDPTQLHQVVLNLCANAVQAMRNGGVLTVRVDFVPLERPLPLATSTLPQGQYVRLAVIDTGIGMARDLLERIFDPFFTTKEVGVGTGLGLSLVHGIVTDLGGGIAVESTEGQGSRFTVWLPATTYVAAAVAPQAPVPPGRGETVMLVDDEEPLVRLGEELLAELGYEPVGFVSSRDALAAFRADPERFDAVLSDEAMPALTGSELAAELHTLRPALPIVLMSGFVSPALLQRARELGVHEVLAKPLASADIARSLAAALAPARAATQPTEGAT